MFNFSFPETNKSFLRQNSSSSSLEYVILPVKMQLIVWLVFYLVTSFLKRHQESTNFITNPLDIGKL